MLITTLTGTVHPEAGRWYLDRPIRVTRGDEEIQLMVQNSMFAIRVTTPSDGDVSTSWYHELWLRASMALRGALDTLGMFKGAVLEVELKAGFVDNKQVIFRDPSTPSFALVSDEHVPPEKLGPVILAALSNRHLRHALADLRQALVLDDDASFYCYRAIESVRQHYLDGNKDDRAARQRSWEKLREELDVTKSDIDLIGDAAKSRRHGGSAAPDSLARAIHVTWTRDLIERFAASLPQDFGRVPEFDA